MSEHQGPSENSKAASLVSGRQVCGNHVDEGGDTEGGLQGDEMDEASSALLCVLGEYGSDLSSAGVCEEGEDSAKGRDGHDSVVELDGAGVFEHVAPPQVRAVFLAGVELVPQLRLGRGETEAHLGEFVVDEAGVETGDQATGHGSEEDETGDTKN